MFGVISSTNDSISIILLILIRCIIRAIGYFLYLIGKYNFNITPVRSRMGGYLLLRVHNYIYFKTVGVGEVGFCIRPSTYKRLREALKILKLI